MNKKRLLLSLILVPLVLAGGMLFMQRMIALRSKPARSTPPIRGALVQVVAAERGSRQVVITTTGTIQAARQAELAPQVAGVIDDTAPHLQTGAFFAAGDFLFAIDDTDYRLTLQQAEASVAKAKSQLAILQAKAAVARREWHDLVGADSPPPPLAVLEPQIAEAEATLAAAEAGRRQAMVNLERTRITAPFDCRILTEAVERGKYVKAGTPLVTVIGADRLEVVVPVALADLAWIPVGGSTPAKAEIVLRARGRERRWSGTVDRLLADVEPRGKMARLIVTIEHPYDDDTEPPLLGMFVDVTIHGRRLDDVIAIPRRTLREGEVVWVVEDDRIRIQPVHVLRLTRDEAWIDRGLAGGEAIVTTALSGVADGMLVRRQENEDEGRP